MRLPAETQRLLERCSFPPPGTPLACAVSGGADSLALMVLAVAGGCKVHAYHVDHGLRPGSSAEAGIVRQAAERFGADFTSLSVEVAPGPNLEARARAARFSVLPPGIATGHTMDDQAETVLLNMLRGSGIDGLAGMAPGPSHPLLGIRRREAALVCEVAGLDPVSDPTNHDPSFLRNRVRHELLPMCNAMARRDLVPVLARQAALARSEAALLEELSRGIDPTDAKALRAAPVPIARRALRRWLRQEHPPDLATIERVLEVAKGERRATDVGQGRSVRRHCQRLILIEGGFIEGEARTAGDMGGLGSDGDASCVEPFGRSGGSDRVR